MKNVVGFLVTLGLLAAGWVDAAPSKPRKTAAKPSNIAAKDKSPKPAPRKKAKSKLDGQVGVPCCQGTKKGKSATKPAVQPPPVVPSVDKESPSSRDLLEARRFNERVKVLVEQIQVEANSLQARLKALQDLGQLRDKAAPAVKVVLYVMKTSKFSAVRQTAAFTLADIGRSHPLTVPGLIQALKDKDQGVRECAASALGNMQGKASGAVSALLLASKGKSANLQSIVAWSLGNIGVYKKTVLSRLKELSKNKEKRVANNASVALKRLLRKAEEQQKAKQRKSPKKKATPKKKKAKPASKKKKTAKKTVKQPAKRTVAKKAKVKKPSVKPKKVAPKSRLKAKTKAKKKSQKSPKAKSE